PVSGRIRLGCDRGIRGGHGRQRDALAGPGGDPLRVHETVAADPYAVSGGRQVRHHEAALVVRDDYANESGIEIRGFGDDPDTGLRAVSAHDDAADIVVVDG